MADFDKFMDDIVQKEERHRRTDDSDASQVANLVERELRIKRERELRRRESPAQKSRWT